MTVSPWRLWGLKPSEVICPTFDAVVTFDIGGGRLFLGNHPCPAAFCPGPHYKFLDSVRPTGGGVADCRAVHFDWRNNRILSEIKDISGK